MAGGGYPGGSYVDFPVQRYRSCVNLPLGPGGLQPRSVAFEVSPGFCRTVGSSYRSIWSDALVRVLKSDDEVNTRQDPKDQ